MASNNHVHSNTIALKTQLKITLYYVLISALVFVFAWYWLSQQLDALLSAKVQEIGYNSAEVTAKASAEAVVAEDKLFLQTLVDDLADSSFVVTAAIYQLNGVELVSSQTATENDQQMSATALQSSWLERKVTGFLPIYSSNNAPYLVEIDWDGAQVGWVEVKLDRGVLEADIRQQSYLSTLYLLAAWIFILLLMLSYSMRFYFKRRKVANEPNNAAAPSSLDALAAQLKQGDIAPNAPHFTSPVLKMPSESEHNSQEFKGWFALILIRKLDHEKVDQPTVLEQLSTWHEAIMEACAALELHIDWVGRHQFLVRHEADDTQPLVKLLLLMHQLDAQLASSHDNHCRVSIVIDKGHFWLTQTSASQVAVLGESFEAAAKQLRAHNRFASICESLAATLEDESHQLEQTLNISVMDNPEQPFYAPTELFRVIDRQANQILKKFWPTAVINAQS